mgnify:CR=1 FL=1
MGQAVVENAFAFGVGETILEVSFAVLFLENVKRHEGNRARHEHFGFAGFTQRRVGTESFTQVYRERGFGLCLIGYKLKGVFGIRGIACKGNVEVAQTDI